MNMKREIILDWDDQSLREIDQRAAEQGTTFEELAENQLRRYFEELGIHIPHPSARTDGFKAVSMLHDLPLHPDLRNAIGALADTALSKMSDAELKKSGEEALIEKYQ